MIELGQLDAAHEAFAKRNIQVVAASIDDVTTSRATQADFPHLRILADAQGNLSKTLKVMDPGAGPGGADIPAPTTLIIDGTGVVRWVFRPDRFLTRLSPEQVLEAVDLHLP